MQERRWVRWGGWSALAAGALTLVLIALQIMAVGARRSSDVSAARWETLTATAATVALCTAVGLITRGTFAALWPPSWASRSGAGAGLVGALMLLAGALGEPFAMRGLALMRLFGWVPLGLWMISVAAAGWRLKRLPVWLRVYGAALGALLMLLPALPETASADLLLSLPWWFGLGAALLRMPSPLAGEGGARGGAVGG